MNTEFSSFDFKIENIYHIFEKQAQSDWFFKNQSNSEYNVLVYCIEGSALYNLNNKTISVCKGDTMFFTRETERSAKADSENPWRFISVAFSVSFSNKKDEALFANLPHLISCSGYSTTIGNLFAELEHDWIAQRNAYKIMCKSIITQIICAFIDTHMRAIHKPNHYYTTEIAIQEMIKNIDSSFSIKELTDKIGISSSYFRKIFKEVTGYSPNDYQTNLKINKAKSYLRSGEFSVTKTAELLGFSDVYYFSRIFKKTTGHSPIEYKPRQMD